MIAGMTPEQVLALRAKFEASYSKMSSRWATGADGLPATHFNLGPDGFSYEILPVNNAWEWFIDGYSACFEELTKKSNVKDRDAADELRRMRQYSSCFTKAFDKKEPVFVLRAQDEKAPLALAQWINAYQPLIGESHYKLIAAKATLGVFMNWPNKKKAD